MALLQRLTWFGIAAAVGILWAFGAVITGRPLELHAHAVLGALFTSALAAGGFDVAAFVQWRRESRGLIEQLGIPPHQRGDVRAIVAAMIEQDPSILTAVRRALGPGREDR